MAKLHSSHGRLGPRAEIAEGLTSLINKYKMLVGHTLIRADSWLVPILLVNSGETLVSFPSRTRLARIEPVATILVAQPRERKTTSSWPPHLTSLVEGVGDLSEEN